MRALLVLSMLLVPVLSGASFVAGAAHAQSSGGGSDDSGGAPDPPAGAAEDSSEGASEADPAARKPKLGIDSLLRPRSAATPRSVRPQLPTEEAYGGRNREAWAKVFADARTEVLDTEQRVEKTRKSLGEKSQGNYTYSPLGGTDTSTTDPEVQKLTAQLRRDRKDLEAARNRFRDLQVEASLAGVPKDWVPSLPPSTSSGASKSAQPPADSARPD